MPRNIERKLLLTARRRGFSKRRAEAYVYGTLRKVNRKKH